MTLSNEGFSTEAQYTANPRVEVPGKTTRGFIPGPIKPGQWAAELGVAAVIPQSEGDADGKVKWRVEIDLANDPAFADEPYQPAPYNTAPARAHAGWYAGDFHVHAEHSAYGNAPMSEVFGYAFKPIAEGGAGPRLHHPLRLRVRLPGVERDRPLPGAVQAQPGGAKRRGDHLPRAHQQPRQRPLRGLPHRADLRTARGRLAEAPEPGPPAQRHLQGGPPLRRLDPDQPPHDLPAGEPRRGRVLPRAASGSTPTPRPTTPRWTRSRWPPGCRSSAPGPNPFTVTAIAAVRAPARARVPDRRGGIERLAPGRPRTPACSTRPWARPPPWSTRPSCPRTASAAACRPTTPT